MNTKATSSTFTRISPFSEKELIEGCLVRCVGSSLTTIEKGKVIEDLV